MKRKRKRVQRGDIFLTITGWAKALGRDAKTIAMRLRDDGVEVLKNSEYPMRTVLAAVYGDEQSERNRNLKLDADRKEREESEAKGELVRLTVIEGLLVDRVVLPLRERLLNQATRLDALCNPSDPQLARQAITADVDETLKLIREKLQ